VGKLDQPISCQKIITWNLVNAMLVMVDQTPPPINLDRREKSRKDFKYLSNDICFEINQVVTDENQERRTT
jgi:hypothetical protein